jgi:hypothetical protein
MNMKTALKAVELEGCIDDKNELHLDGSLPFTGPSRVRVIVIMPEDSDIDEKEWLKAAASNPSFQYLEDPKENIYSVSDGKPFYG